MATQPNSGDRPATIGLSLYRGDDHADTSPTESMVELTAEQSLDLAEEPSAPELSDLLDAWQTATARLEKTHAQLRDEVSRLSSELEVKNRELARKNRLADLGEMASHVAHEVRNSLTPITLYLSLLRRSLTGDAKGLEVLGKAEAGFTALEATVNDLLSFSAHRQPHPTQFLVSELIEELAESLAPQFDAQAVDIELDIPPNTLLWADREMIRRAVLNLMLNALDVMPQGGDLLVTACEGFEGFELEIADSGPGIPEKDEPRLFEPFFSTKETGTGLGLSVVAHVAEAHGGSVIAENCPIGGAAFTLRIPRPMARGAAA
jgi:signal transduction histidine kinase